MSANKTLNVKLNIKYQLASLCPNFESKQICLVLLALSGCRFKVVLTNFEQAIEFNLTIEKLATVSC